MAVKRKRYVIWTDPARIQLVEAVIKVEEEIKNEISRGGDLSERSKWSRVARLLPRDMQGRVWSCRHQKFQSNYKCQGMFHDLLKVYKEKLAGLKTPHSRRKMIKPLWELIKKREEFLQVRSSNRPNDTSFQRGFEWTEPDRLLVIQAVISVEEEDRVEKAHHSIRSLTGRKKLKWERVANLLPSKLRRNCQQQTRNNDSGRSCECLIKGLLSAYRRFLQDGSNGSGKYRLTKPVYEMLKKRDGLLNSRSSSRHETMFSPRGSQSASESCSIGSYRTHSGNNLSGIHQRHFSQTSNSFLDMHDNNEEHLSEGRSVCTAKQPAAASSPESINELEASVAARSFENDEEEIKRNDTENDSIEAKCMQTTSEGAAAKHRSGLRSIGGERQDSEHENYPGLSTPSELHSTSNIRGTRDPRTAGVQTCPREKDSDYCCKRLSSSHSRAAGLKRKTGPSLSETDGLEILNANMDGLVTRLDLELSRLRSWVQNRSIPVARIMMREMITSAMRSCETDHVLHSAKRTGIEAFELKQKKLSRKIGHRLHASLQQLRTRFAEELQRTSVELAEKVLQESELLHTYKIQFRP